MTKPENTQQNQEKLKVVVFVGDQMEEQRDEILTYVTGKKLKGVKLLSDKMENIKLEELQGLTDKNTIFVILAHGLNELGEISSSDRKFHYIDDIKTGWFLDNLKDAVGHEINAALFSCHGGGVLKRNELIDKGVSLMVAASNKYPSISMHNMEGILKILQWKIQEGFSNQRIYEELPRQIHETVYYYDDSGKEPLRLPRIGKFDLKEVRKTLAKLNFKEDGSKLIIETLEKSGKKNFNIRSIVKQLSAVRKGLDAENYEVFIKQLKADLEEKISPEGIRNFIKNRNIVESKEADQKGEISDDKIKDYVFDILVLAVSDRDDIDLVRAIAAVYGEDIINRIDSEGLCPLIIAAGSGFREILETLLNSGGDVNMRDSNGNTALMGAMYSNHDEIAKMLILDYNADVSIANNDGITALILAVINDNEDMVRFLIAKEDKNTDTTKTRVKPLIDAIENDQAVIVQIFLDDARTPLDNIDALINIAKTRNNIEITKMLNAALVKNKNSSELSESKKVSHPSEAVHDPSATVPIKAKSEEEKGHG